MAPTARRMHAGSVELALLEAGTDGRPLFLVHGFTGAGADFADHVEVLAAAGWHVVAPDQRGHGTSDAPEGEQSYSLRVYADDLLALANALGWERFVMLGHSMGGMIAQTVALAAPQRLDALVLMDTSHGPVEIDPDLVASAAELVRADGMDALADVLAAGPEGPLETPAARRLREERPDLVEYWDQRLRGVSADMYVALATEMLRQDDRLDALARLDVPTLVIVGEQDGPFLGPSRRMADAIPGARLEVLPDAGHSPQQEAPETWFKALRSFLDEVPDVSERSERTPGQGEPPSRGGDEGGVNS